MTATEISDRFAIRELVDEFSILSDKKDAHGQTFLFTPDAAVDTYVNGALMSQLKGRKQMEETFGGFLKNFETVYHFNGQQVVKLDGDHATGALYCTVTLIGTENGKKMMTQMGVTYDDEYLRSNGHWLISKRISHFVWQHKHDLPSAQEG